MKEKVHKDGPKAAKMPLMIYYAKLHDNILCMGLVLATGQGNPPAVQVWTAKTGLFGSRPIQKPNPLTLGGPKPGPVPVNPWGLPGLAWPIGYNHKFCVSGFKCKIAFRYATVNGKILTFVRHSLFLIYWPPYCSERTQTADLTHPENERE